MADKAITVRYNSAPGAQTFVLTDFRNEDNPNLAVNITGFFFKLIVKRFTDDPDSEAFFELDGAIVTPLDGIFSFTFTAEHTTIPPDIYPGEIRWWSGGAPATGEPPTDALTVDYSVQQGVRADEP